MNNREEQEMEELTVFGEFAKLCPLPLLHETATPGPDPPDVLCETESGETFGFELVECGDVTQNYARPGRAYIAVHPWKLENQVELRKELREAYREACEARNVGDLDGIANQFIHVDFENGFPTKNSRREAIQEVINVVDQLGSGRHQTRHGVIRIRCTPCPGGDGTSLEGPVFRVGGPCGARPYIVERIKEKLKNNYESNHQIHLLAWSTTATVEEFEFTNGRERLVELVQSNGMGPFDRIWVFGYGRKSIVFDSADLVIGGDT